MKKTLTALLAACMLVTCLTACSSTSTATTETAPAETTTTTTTEATTQVEEVDITFTSPILLTSGGQSADYQMINTVMEKAGMEATMNNLATSADLDGIETLVVVIGGSSKGLGAAGIDENGIHMDSIATIADVVTILPEIFA